MDGFVAANMNIAGIASQVPAGRWWQSGVIVAFIAGRNVHVTVFTCFSLRLVAPAARHDEIGRGAVRKIQWHDGVFCESAALHEQYFEVGWNGHQRTKISFRVFVNGDEFFAAVAHLHDAHAAAMPVQHLGRSLLQNRFGQYGRPCRKIERPGHFLAAGLPVPAGGAEPTILVAVSLNCWARAAISGRAASRSFCTKILPSSGVAAWYFLTTGDSKNAANCFNSSRLKRSA